MKKLGIFVIFALLAGCTPKTDEQLFADAIEAQKGSQHDEAIEVYQEVVAKYPQSPRAPEALYAIGTIYQDQKKDFPKAIESYRKLVEAYPTHATSPNAQFLIGFINNNELKNVEAARVAYESFLQKYPESSLASSARFELDHLGKDAAQILEEQTKPPAKQGRK